jgi:hypothetical protein
MATTAPTSESSPFRMKEATRTTAPRRAPAVPRLQSGGEPVPACSTCQPTHEHASTRLLPNNCSQFALLDLFQRQCFDHSRDGLGPCGALVSAQPSYTRGFACRHPPELPPWPMSSGTKNDSWTFFSSSDSKLSTTNAANSRPPKKNTSQAHRSRTTSSMPKLLPQGTSHTPTRAVNPAARLHTCSQLLRLTAALSLHQTLRRPFSMEN